MRARTSDFPSIVVGVAAADGEVVAGEWGREMQRGAAVDSAHSDMLYQRPSLRCHRPPPFFFFFCVFVQVRTRQSEFHSFRFHSFRTSFFILYCNQPNIKQP